MGQMPCPAYSRRGQGDPSVKTHGVESFFVVGEGVLEFDQDGNAAQLGEDVNLDELVQGRSPALDLDSVYGRGPNDKDDRKFYAEDGVKLKIGTTSPTDIPDDRTKVALAG